MPHHDPDPVLPAADLVAAVQSWAAAQFHHPPAEAPTRPAALLTDGLPFSFRYGGADARDLLPHCTRTSRTAAPDGTQCESTWTAPAGDLRVSASATVFPRFAAVEWLLHFENPGPRDSAILADIQALDLRLATSPATQPVTLHQVHGDTCNADTFLPFDTALPAGATTRIVPVGGRSSNHSFPFINLAAGERGLIAAIGWSGQWCIQFDRDADGTTRFRAGLERTHLRLRPGERIRSPRILLLPWTGDRTAAHNRFRRLMLAHYVSRALGRAALPPVALQCFDRYARTVPTWATEAGQLEAVAAAHDLGCDTHWLDAAWFPGDFPHGVGNWHHKPAEFPRGLAPVSAACRARGLKFMLWFEPERVAPGTTLAHEHPEFYDSAPHEGLPGGLFKLGDPAARAWLTDLLSTRIREYGVDIYRNDFNFDPLPFWRAMDAPDRVGMAEIRYIEGLYELWDTLRARHPGLLIDNCASGGRRIDLETCMRSLPLWRSDTGCSQNPVDWNQVQCCGLSLYVPVHAVASWTPAAYEVRSVASAGVVCQWDYLNPAFDFPAARRALAEARGNQQFWCGDFYPLTPVTNALDQWAVYQFHRADLDAGIVLAFRRGESQVAHVRCCLHGVDRAAEYRLELHDEDYAAHSLELPGAALRDPGLDLHLPQQRTSLLVRYRRTARPQDSAARR